MLQPGDRVVAGVSGGADSVCLLFLLLEWRREFPLDIAVVHVNHGIRPEAGEDARYVENCVENIESRFPDGSRCTAAVNSGKMFRRGSRPQNKI